MAKKNYKFPYADELLKEYERVWGKDAHMVEFCMGRISNTVKLECGLIVEFGKRQIEKDFPVAEGMAREFDEAVKLCQEIGKDERYFISRNMRGVEDEIDKLTSADKVYVIAKSYNTCGETRIGEVWLKRGWFDRDEGYALISAKDKLELLKVMQEEREKHEKKVMTYLKRYGLSKIRTWTYWDQE